MIAHITRSEWLWNSTCQHLHTKTKAIIKKNVTIAFFNEKEWLYLEADALGVGLRESLLHVRDGIHFPRNKAAGQYSASANSIPKQKSGQDQNM